MKDFNTSGVWSTAPAKADMSVDAGLRAFMLGVYNKLALGLLISAVLAYVVGTVPEVQGLMFQNVDGRIGFTPLGLGVKFAPLIAILGSMFLMRNPSPAVSAGLYWFVVASIGASGGLWFLLYTGGSIASTFVVTAASFGALSLFGYVTKRDLRPMGSFLIMALFGIILAGIANIFLHSGAMSLIISCLGVLIFAGLIAYDTQNLKMMYYRMGGDQRSMAVATNFGALNLYLNFVNLFQFLLSIFGGRR